MNCDGVRGLLSAYLDGELSPGDLLRVEQHLRHCHWCADEVDSLRQTVTLVSSLEEVELPPMFHVQLHQRLVALGPPQMAVRRIASAPSHQKKAANLRWAVPAAAAAAVLAIGLTSYSNGGQTLPGLLAEKNVVVDPAETASQAQSIGTPVAVNEPGAKPSTTQPTTPVDSGMAAKPTTTATNPQPEPAAPIGSTPPSNGGGGAYVATNPVGTETAPQNLSPKLTYTAELTAAGHGPEILAKLKAQYPDAALQVNKLVITVPTESFADTLKAVATSLGLDVPTPVSSDLALQIKEAEALLQTHTVALKNFEAEYNRMDEATKASAKPTLDNYQQMVVSDQEYLATLNLNVKTSTITVQLQPAAR